MKARAMIQAETYLEQPFRLALSEDIPQILPLAPTTVPGFIEHLWSRLANQDETADEFGRRAQAAFVAEQALELRLLKKA